MSYGNDDVNVANILIEGHSLIEIYFIFSCFFFKGQIMVIIISVPLAVSNLIAFFYNPFLIFILLKDMIK